MSVCRRRLLTAPFCVSYIYLSFCGRATPATAHPDPSAAWAPIIKAAAHTQSIARQHHLSTYLNQHYASPKASRMSWVLPQLPKEWVLGDYQDWNLAHDVVAGFAALFHDVGKVLTPKGAINHAMIALLDAGDMSETERKRVRKQHTSYGAAYLRQHLPQAQIWRTALSELGVAVNLDVRRAIIAAAAGHHGQIGVDGYPTGLAPPDPLVGLVALADHEGVKVFGPIDRGNYIPASERKTVARALAEFIDGSGRLYHPDAVTARLAIAQPDELAEVIATAITLATQINPHDAAKLAELLEQRARQMLRFSQSQIDAHRLDKGEQSFDALRDQIDVLANPRPRANVETDL